MASSILQGNVPFNASVYTRKEVDGLIEEHSHYIVSSAGTTYIRPTDDGMGTIDRTITVGKVMTMTCATDERTILQGKDGEEVVWEWSAPEDYAGYTVNFVGPFTSSSGETVYVPSDSSVFDGFNPEAFYANLWCSVVTAEPGTQIVIEPGTVIERETFRPYSFDDGVVLDFPEGESTKTVDGVVYGISSDHSSFTIDGGQGGVFALSRLPDGTVSVTYPPFVHVESGSVSASDIDGEDTFRIRYKNFPQWFTFSEEGLFIGHGVYEASGGVAGRYYDDSEAEVISDSRTIATLKDLSDITATTFAGEPPIDVVKSENTVTVLHRASGADPGNYGDTAGSRTVDFGDRIQSVYQHVDITGHVNSISTSDIVLPSNASKLWVGDESNDMYVKDAINEIREEIGGGGSGGSIIQRLDAVEGRLDSNDETIEDIYGRLDSNDDLIDDISNDLANHTHDFIVSPDGDTKVHANDDGTATIDVTGSDLALPVVRISPGSECSGTGSSVRSISWPDGATIDFNDPRVVLDHGYYYYIEDGIRYVLISTGGFVIQQTVGDVWEFSISEYASQSPALTFLGGSAYEASCTGTFSMSRDYAVDTKTVATTDQIVPFSRIVSDNGTVVVETHDAGNATISTGVKPGCVRVYQDFTGQPNDPKYPLTLEFSCSLDELASSPANRAFRILYDGTTYECTTGTGHQGIFPISGGPSWVESLSILSVQDSSGNHTYIELYTGTMTVFGNRGETYSTYEYHATEKTLATVDQIVPSDRIVSPDESARVVVHNDGTASIDTDTVVMSVPSDFTFMRITVAESGDVVMKGPYPYTYRGNTVYAWIASDLDPSTFNPFTARNDHLCLLGSTDSEPEFIALSGDIPFPVYNIQPGSWTSGTPIVSKAQNPSMYSGGDVSLSIGESREIATVDMLADLSNDIVGEIEERLNVVEGQINDLSNDIHLAIDDLSNDVTDLRQKDSELESRIDDLSNDVNSRLDDLSNDIGEVIDTKLTEIEGRIDDLSNDVYSAIDDLSNDVSLRAMDDNVVHKTGPLVNGQMIVSDISQVVTEDSGHVPLVMSGPNGQAPIMFEQYDFAYGDAKTRGTGLWLGTACGYVEPITGWPELIDSAINFYIHKEGPNPTTTEAGFSYLVGQEDSYEITIPQKSGVIVVSEDGSIPLSDDVPKMDGLANPGKSSGISRSDHVHPSDTTRVPVDKSATDLTYLTYRAYPYDPNRVPSSERHFDKGERIFVGRTKISGLGDMDVFSCFQAKKDASAVYQGDRFDWSNQALVDEFWLKLDVPGGYAASYNASVGELVWYKGEYYECMRSCSLDRSVDYGGSKVPSNIEILLSTSFDKLGNSSEYTKDHIEDIYQSKLTVANNKAILSYYDAQNPGLMSISFPEGFKVYGQNDSGDVLLYSAPAGGETIVFRNDYVTGEYDGTTYVLRVPVDYTFVDMETLFGDGVWFVESSSGYGDNVFPVAIGHQYTDYVGVQLVFYAYVFGNNVIVAPDFGSKFSIPAGSQITGSMNGTFVSKTLATSDQLVEPATAVPLVDSSSASVGVSLKYAREDHVHPLSDRIVSPDGNTTVTATDNKVATVTYPTSTITSVFFPEGFSISSDGGYGVYTYTAPSGGETITFKGPYRMNMEGYSNYMWYPTNLPDDPQEELDPSSYDPWRWFIGGSTESTANNLLFGGNFGFSVSNWDSEHPTLTIDQSSTMQGDMPVMTRSGSDFVTKTLAVSDHTHASIVSGDTTVSAVEGGTALIIKAVPPTYGNMVVTFPADYRITDDYVTYTGPGTVEFKGPYYNESLDYTFWYPTDLQDDPGASFDPSNYHVWCLSVHGDDTVPEYMMYETGMHYYVSEWNSVSPKLTLGSGTVSGSKPQASRNSSPNPSITKRIATVDQLPGDVVESVNNQTGTVWLTGKDIYTDESNEVTITDAINNAGKVRSVNDQDGDVWLTGDSIFTNDSNDIYISDALRMKQDLLQFDDVPEALSDNPVKSSGIYSYYPEGVESKIFEAKAYFDNNGVFVLRKEMGFGNISVTFPAGFIVQGSGKTFSANEDTTTVFSEGALAYGISGTTYLFWIPEGIIVGPDFDPFDEYEENNYGVDWFFWAVAAEGVTYPTYFTYKNGPSYSVSNWMSTEPSVSIISGAESGGSIGISRSKVYDLGRIISSSDASNNVPVESYGEIGYSGGSERYSREDHRHPSDQSRVAQGDIYKMLIGSTGEVTLEPGSYVYKSNSGIASSGESIAVPIPAGTDDGGIYVSVNLGYPVSYDGVNEGYMGIYYNVANEENPVYLFRANISLSSSGSLSYSGIPTIGEDANGVAFNTTQAYQYITNGDATIRDYTGTGGSFVINCGTLVWTSGGQNPNTTIDIPSTKTLATTKYVDDAIAGGGGGGVSSVNGQHGPVVVLDGTDILVDESNDVRTIAEAISDIPASSVMYDESNSETVADALSRLDADMGDIASVLDAINGESL